MEFEMMHLEGKDPRLQRYSRKRTKKLALPDIKTSHKVIIIKMQCIYCFRNRQTDHYNKMESHEIGSHILGTLIYDRLYMTVDKKGRQLESIYEKN